MSSRGRRPGDSRSRELILDAARAAFAERGYAAATVRSVGRAAGVDPALVHHYFGTKEELFAAAMALPLDPATAMPSLLEGPPGELGARLLRFFLGLWEDPATRDRFRAVLTSAVSQEAAAAMLREFVSRALLGRLAAALDLPDAQLRAAAAGSQLVGLAMVRYVVRVEPLASASVDEVVALMAPALQQYLSGG